MTINGDHSTPPNSPPPDDSVPPKMALPTDDHEPSAEGASKDCPDVMKIRSLIELMTCAQEAVNSPRNSDKQWENLQVLRDKLRGMRLGDFEKWLDDLNALFNFHYDNRDYLIGQCQVMADDKSKMIGIRFAITNVKAALMQMTEAQAVPFIQSLLQASQRAFAPPIVQVKQPGLILPPGIGGNNNG